MINTKGMGLCQTRHGSREHGEVLHHDCSIAVSVTCDKDKDGLLPRSEYMEFGCRGVHHTYIHTYT